MSAFVLGAGCSRGCPVEELLELVLSTLVLGGVTREQVRTLATIDTRGAEPAIVETARRMGWQMRTHAARALATVDVPTPSAVVAAHVGTPSVAEAAALLSAPGGRLAVPKQRSRRATCALAEASG